MKPHIAQTIADLNTEKNLLQEIIDTLTAWGNATSDQTERIHIPGSNGGSGIMVDILKDMPMPQREEVTITPAKPKRHYTPRQPKPKQTPADLEAPTTFAGACKRILREATGPIGTDHIWNTVLARWPDLLDGKEKENLEANIRYWVVKGHCEKLGNSQFSTYRVINQEFFQEIA